MHLPVFDSPIPATDSRLGRGGRIRTCGCRDQNPVPWATWRRPCIDSLFMCRSRATPPARHATGIALRPAPTRLAFRQAARPMRPARWRRSSNSTKHALPDPVSRGTPIRGKRGERGFDGRFALAQHRLEGVAHCTGSKAPRRNEVGHFHGQRIPRQIRGLEQFGGGHVHAAGRPGHTTPAASRSADSRSPTPSAQALWPRTKTGTSAPSRKAKLGQALRTQIQAPYGVQRHQRRCRVGGAAAQPGAARNLFFDDDIRP